MAEREQSGMLKIVVVLALILVIALGLIAGTKTLTASMNSKTNQTNQKVDDAKGIAEANSLAVQLLDSKNVSLKTARAADVNQKYKDPNTWTFATNGGNGSAQSQNGHLISTGTNGNWLYSPLVKIPSGAKQVTVTVSVKSGSGFAMLYLIGGTKATSANVWGVTGQSPDFQTLKVTQPLNNGILAGSVGGDSQGQSFDSVGIEVLGVNSVDLSSTSIDFE